MSDPIVVKKTLGANVEEVAVGEYALRETN